ncbi:diacylglycerol kinase [Kingella negevensis]|uniref:diacylglycerol kinase n=1 Tax=Kingella negevensis TaxID=1522312 RepID=UPI002542FA68|nr:diacylglycerol kinase [Kingella negevensis]WII93090.1 diacylglycerol kinase [Kingella negevensis]
MSEIQTNHLKGTRGFRRVLNAAGYSKDGLIAAYQHEAAFRQLVVLHAVLLIAVWCFDFDSTQRMILIAASFLSLITELFNSGIEAVVDDISLEIRPLAKRAKDVGSAAQMLALTLIAILWAIALFS